MAPHEENIIYYLWTTFSCTWIHSCISAMCRLKDAATSSDKSTEIITSAMDCKFLSFFKSQMRYSWLSQCWKFTTINLLWVFLSWYMTNFISQDLSQRMVILLQTLKSCCWQLFIVILINTFLLLLFVLHVNILWRKGQWRLRSLSLPPSPQLQPPAPAQRVNLSSCQTPQAYWKRMIGRYMFACFSPVGFQVICLWLLTPNLACLHCMYGWHVLVHGKIDYHFVWLFKVQTYIHTT